MERLAEHPRKSKNPQALMIDGHKRLCAVRDRQ
jgi:hypothetical protein